jgi:peroxiredoxin
MTDATIADQVSSMVASLADQPPNEAMAAFGIEQADLETAGPPAGVIAIGSRLDDADLLDPQGVGTTLYQALGERPAVLVFYRGAWCPYCNITLSTYQRELLPQLNRRGVTLIAVSPQAPDGSLSMQEKNELTFTVLSDPGNQLARQVGVLTAPSTEVRAAQLQLGLDLTAVNADGTVELPMPTTVILDAEHTVRWIDVHPNYSTRSEPMGILVALDVVKL